MGTSDAAGAGPAGGQPLTVLEALHSTPARRYLAADPIPDDVLWAILDAAIRGPSACRVTDSGGPPGRRPAREVTEHPGHEHAKPLPAAAPEGGRDRAGSRR